MTFNLQRDTNKPRTKWKWVSLESSSRVADHRHIGLCREARMESMDIRWGKLKRMRNVAGRNEFQLDIRSSNEREWKENGQLVRAEPKQVHYRQALGSLPLSSQYFVRVRAVDNSLTTVATSPSTSFSVACQSRFPLFFYRKFLDLQLRFPQTMSDWTVSLTASCVSRGMQ